MGHRLQEPQAGDVRYELVGSITSAGFASGDRFVVGHWEASPLGPFTDVMWARPGGERVLLAPGEAAGRFVGAVYVFDAVEVVPVAAGWSGAELGVAAGPVALRLRAGPGWRLPLPPGRPAWVTRWVEGPVAAALLGVRTYGVSPTGVREWYRADTYRPLVAAGASVAGRDLGPLRRRWERAGFGFSEPPRSSATVGVRPLLHDPAGRLERVLAAYPVDEGRGSPAP